MLHDYAVRITHTQTDIRRVINVWATRCHQVIAYEHDEPGKKIHSHLLIKGANIEKKQLRNLGNSTGINLKGNENCSFKAYDQNTTYLSYMSRGRIEPYYIQNFTTEEIQTAKEAWVPPQEYVKLGSNEHLYNEFEKHILMGSEDVFETNVYKDYLKSYDYLNKMDTTPRFEYIRRKAHYYAFVKNRQIATPKFFNEFKMLVATFCFREGVPFPKDKSLWTKLY